MQAIALTTIAGLLAGYLLHVWQSRHIAAGSERPALAALSNHARGGN
jgi:hypothetical protein